MASLCRASHRLWEMPELTAPDRLPAHACLVPSADQGSAPTRDRGLRLVLRDGSHPDPWARRTAAGQWERAWQPAAHPLRLRGTQRHRTRSRPRAEHSSGVQHRR
jgi:hypothetical protein